MSANPRTTPAARRALVAVAVPTTMAALLCTATLAGTAFASGSSSTTPTAPCSASAGAPGKGAPSTKGAPTKPAPTGSATAVPSVAPPSIAPPVIKTTAPPAAPPTTDTPLSGVTPAPTPSATATDGSGGIWGWLNGVWQLLVPGVGEVVGNLLSVAAAGPMHEAPVVGAPIIGAASGHTGTAACAPTTAAPLHRDDAAPAPDKGALIPWHLSTPSMTMHGLTFNGVDSVQTANGSLQVLDFTVQRVEIVSMVTYSYPGGPNAPRQYNNAGSGTTTVLNNVHLWTTSMTADLYGVPIPVTLTPTSPVTTILGVAQDFTIPIPVVFTNVDADNAFMSASGLNVPGFKGYAGS